MVYRDDVTALSAKYDALEHEVAQKTRELETSRRLLEDARERARLPVLDNIRIAAPCTVDWNAMTGDERARLCGECKKIVFNLTGMTRDQAEALIRERHGELCVRYYQRRDGTIVLADCTIPARDHHRWIAAGAAAVVAGGIGVAASLYQLGNLEKLEQAPHTAMPPPPPPPALTQPRPVGKQGRPMVREHWTMGLPAFSDRVPRAEPPITRQPKPRPPRAGR